ncbi:hypothetical protein D3C73_926050 [compost metagenome]
MEPWMIGLLGSSLIAAAAYIKRSFSRSGAMAAVILGTMMYTLGSLAWFGTLIIFFISSTVLSKLKHKRKEAAEKGYAKGGRRDAGQVAANGGIGLLLCIGNAWMSDPIWWMVYVGVMATVTADTWATELGGLSKIAPRSIVTGKPVAPGTSGGITLLGLSASAAGGLLIGASAWLFMYLGSLPYAGLALSSSWTWVTLLENKVGSLWVWLVIGGASGLVGSCIDSWLGAVWQVMYRCKKCGRELEKPIHCDYKADRIRGYVWLTNDVVNAISSLWGGVVALLLAFLVFM